MRGRRIAAAVEANGETEALYDRHARVVGRHDGAYLETEADKEVEGARQWFGAGEHDVRGFEDGVSHISAEPTLRPANPVAAAKTGTGIGRWTIYTPAMHRVVKPLGDVDTSIMAVLADGDLHGYAILAEVRKLSEGRMRLGTGTMYGALERLQGSSSVVAAAEEVVDGRTRRYYRLTDAGRETLVTELERREKLLRATRARLAGAT